MRKRLLLLPLGIAVLILLTVVSLKWLDAPMTLAAPQLHSEASEARADEWATLVDKRLNLYAMRPGVYRSALPDSQAQALLDELGVKTVVNFYQRSDAAWLTNPEVRQIHLPFHVDRVTDTTVIAALRSIREAEQLGPVLLHCKHGQHRTGLIAAMYRIIYQGWSKDEALAELYYGGFGGVDRLSDVELYLAKVDIAGVKKALGTGSCSTTPWAWCAIKAKFFSLLRFTDTRGMT